MLAHAAEKRWQLAIEGNRSPVSTPVFVETDKPFLRLPEMTEAPQSVQL